MTDKSSVNFKLIRFLLWTKRSHQSSNFDTSECSGQNLPNSSCHFSSNKSVFLQILHHSSILWNWRVIQNSWIQFHTSLYFFSSNNIYFSKKEPIEVTLRNLWDFWVLLSKFVKFLVSILKRQVDSSPNFVSLSVSWKITPLYYLAQKKYT